MKYSNLIIVFSFLMLLISGCDEEYDYDLNDTTWDIQVGWSGISQGEPDSISFYSDGTTSWGGTWEKTDELTFKWIIVYKGTSGVYTATYYAQFRKNLNELIGHCENTRDITGSFLAYKIPK